MKSESRLVVKSFYCGGFGRFFAAPLNLDVYGNAIQPIRFASKSIMVGYINTDANEVGYSGRNVNGTVIGIVKATDFTNNPCDKVRERPSTQSNICEI